MIADALSEIGWNVIPMGGSNRQIDIPIHNGENSFHGLDPTIRMEIIKIKPR